MNFYFFEYRSCRNILLYFFLLSYFPFLLLLTVPSSNFEKKTDFFLNLKKCRLSFFSSDLCQHYCAVFFLCRTCAHILSIYSKLFQKLKRRSPMVSPIANGKILIVLSFFQSSFPFIIFPFLFLFPFNFSPVLVICSTHTISFALV